MKNFRRITGMMMLWTCLCWGCGPKPDMVNTTPEPGERYSADDVRRMSVDQPFLISGDYFRNRNQKDATPLSDILAKNTAEKKTAPPPEKAATAVASSVPAVPVAAPAPPVNPAPRAETAIENPETAAVSHPVKVGLILDRDRIPAEITGRITAAASAVAGILPVVMADQEEVDEVLTRIECPGKKDLGCLSGALGIYPGVRMVILMESLEPPKQIPGEVTSRITLVDTAVRYRYPIMEIAAPVRKSSETELAIQVVCYRAVDLAVRKSKIVPWSCRAFSRDDEEWHISAGQKSGLKSGLKLAVVSGGKLVKTPAGLPAGWLPGEQKGMMEVTKLFGNDLAVCRLVSGEGPMPDDLLILP